MTPLQNVSDRLKKNKAVMASLLKLADKMTPEDRTKLSEVTAEHETLLAEHRSAELLEADFQAQAAAEFDAGDGEAPAYKKLVDRVDIQTIATSAIEHRALQGAAKELNQHHKLPDGGGHFPLSILFKDDEHRTMTDTTTTRMPRPWADMLFSMTKAADLGIMPEAVTSGTASYPVTRTFPTSGAQRGREQAASVSVWTTENIDIDNSRSTVHVELNSEDQIRNPMLRSASERHLRKAIAQGIDKAIFLGDTGANEDSADITGLDAAVDIVEKTITQTNKLLPNKTLETFTSLLDGVHAETLSDLGVVTSVPANLLWHDTILSVASETASVFRTMRKHLMDEGLMWSTRADLADGTGNGKWLGFAGRKTDLQSSYACPVWNSGQLVVDPYTSAKSAKLLLTLHYFWNFKLIRASSFARIKFIT